MPRQSTVSHVLRMTLLFIAYHAEDIHRFSESQIKSYDVTIIRALNCTNSKCNVATAKDTADATTSLAISTYFGDIESPKDDHHSTMSNAKSTTATQKNGQRYFKDGEIKVVIKDTLEYNQYPMLFPWYRKWTKRQRVQQIPLEEENSPPSMTEEVIGILNGSFSVALIPDVNSELSKNSLTTATWLQKIDSTKDETSGQTEFEAINQNDFISNTIMWYPVYREIKNTANVSGSNSSRMNHHHLETPMSKMLTVLRKKRETTSAKGNIAIEEISGREENLSNDTTDNNEDPAITNAILNLGGTETAIDIYIVGLPWRSNESLLDIKEKTTLVPLTENHGNFSIYNMTFFNSNHSSITEGEGGNETTSTKATTIRTFESQVDDTATFKKKVIDGRNEISVVNISRLPDIVNDETVPSLIWNDYKLTIIINTEYDSRLSELESRLNKLEKEEAVECTSTISTFSLPIYKNQDNRSSILKKQQADERSDNNNWHSSTINQEWNENLTSQSSNLENSGKSIGEYNVSRMREQMRNGNMEKSNDLSQIFPFSGWRFVNLHPAEATTVAAVTEYPRRTSILDNIPKAAVAANTSYRNFVESRDDIGHHRRTYDRYRIVDKPNGRFMNTGGVPNDRTAFPTTSSDKNAEWPASRSSFLSQMTPYSRLSLPSKKWLFQVLPIEGFDLFVPENGVDKDHGMYPQKFWWNLMFFPMNSSYVERRSDLNIDDSLSSVRSYLHDKDTSKPRENFDKSLSREAASLLHQRLLFSVPSTREPVENDDRN